MTSSLVKIGYTIAIMSKTFFFGAGSLITAAFIFAFFGVITRIMGFNIPLFYQSWTRNLLCVFILAIPFALSKTRWKKTSLRDLKWIAARAFGGTIAFVGSYLSFFYLPLGTVLFIFYGGSTIGGYVLGYLFFKERLNKIKLISLLLALGGLLLIYLLNIKILAPLYMVFSFIAGLGVSIWNTFSKKISHRYSATQLNLLDFFFVFVFMLILSLIFREKWTMPTFSTPWLANAGFVVFFISTGQLMIWGFKHIEAQVGSLIMLSEILFGILIGYLFFKETITVFTLLGGMLIITAILLPEIAKSQPTLRLGGTDLTDFD